MTKCASNCFIAGTLVLTESGHKTIENIEIGNKVWAYNEETGEQQLKEVVTLFRNETIFWCTTHIKIDGEDKLCEITSTPGHKFYLPNNKENRNPKKILEHASYSNLSVQWVSAEDLKAGDKVLLSNGKYGIINDIELKKLERPEVTYNIEVSDYHTYYVSEKCILTHNTGNCIGKTEVTDNVIRDAMKDAPLMAQQPAISKPVVQDYVDILIDGSPAPAIKVSNGYIIEGHHRYVAGRIAGIEPAQVVASGGNPKLAVSWDKIKIDPTRW